MKFFNLFSIVMFVAFATVFTSCDQAGTGNSGSVSNATLTTELDSVSYAIGIDIANNLKKSGFDEINSNAIAKGFADVYAENEDIWEAKEANAYVMNYFQKQKEVAAGENLAEADAFLSENGGKDGVVTTESGLQYKVLTEGNGPIPTAEDMVKVYYKGTLIDGREFDGTQEGNPAQFRVNGVIRGWTEALELMPVGSKWELYIHPDLAYGKNPRQGGIIEANDMLIFEIELLEIVKK